MKRLLIIAALVVILPAPVQPQSAGAVDPAAWSLKIEPAKAELRPGGRMTAVVTAAIREGWHVYAVDELPDGPLPLRMVLPPDRPFARDGEIKGPEPEREFEAAFGQVTSYFKSTGSFRIPVKVALSAKPGRHRLAVEVTFQACNGRMCLPARVARLTAPVTVK